MPEAGFRGGCTLLIDLATAEVRYLVRKKVKSEGGWRRSCNSGPTRATACAPTTSLTASRREPFALMHHVHG